MERLWMWDLDNTLVPTNNCYEIGKIAFAKYCCKKMGIKMPQTSRLLAMVNEIDFQEAKKNGFSEHSFKNALSLTLEAICKERGVKCSKKALKEAYNTGKITFSEKLYKELGLIPGASRLLDFLKRRKNEKCVVLTKGQKKTQLKKYKAYNLQRWFSLNDFIIKEDKKPEHFYDIVKKYSPKLLIAVGDSFKSDIQCAFECGFDNVKGVHLPIEHWKFENEANKDIKIDSYGERVITLNGIEEVLANYEKIIK